MSCICRTARQGRAAKIASAIFERLTTRSDAGVAELVYARALGAREATHGGSSPLPSTKFKIVL
jgi:hypothetical protein